ncbi:Peptide methionine sulfoxide reductase MsrA [Liberibacter crescens BT-1]|uniref:Peptide methionine sulfoxide reductase MsrA n=1 Tax=Liberibacter crescens (strain BT-1) TaxID=1215343 RepID=L0EX33_LIBCB|nr:peptide-methionine (S)-S-oxide reductase MsrA [Liberibacter crescens]AGA65218.1 Peptide methionine sulfoxide reductase MsrA [Liberibacter crescens BT-1]AMC13168.1 methionine sulfoxide reductase A [Liberibacter crescens]
MKNVSRAEAVKISLLIALAFRVCFCVKAYAVESGIETNQIIMPVTKTIVLGGGCFWGMEAVFKHTKGVIDVVSGYAGGKKQEAYYDIVSSGKTKHVEVVQVTYNPSQISFSKLLDVYFNVAHDPTQLNYQGPDYGLQYRSVIFYKTSEQKNEAEEKIAVLNQRHIFSTPVVTNLEPLDTFYLAEEYHQNYVKQHKKQPYVVVYDTPKLEKLKSVYPDLYRERE